MFGIHSTLLQLPQNFQASFVIRTGLLIVLLSCFVVFQMVLQRMKKNRLVMEKKHLRESYDSELLKSKVEVQEATFETLGHELHDNIGQLLSTSKLLIGITERNLTNPPESLLSAGEALDKAIAESKGLHEAVKDAVAVPRHELERAQGREVSEQDGKILEAIDKYQDKHFSEGIGFNREEIESELLNHNLTIDFAENRLEHNFKEERIRNNEQERDNGMER